jgi:DNA-binding SARP family transcriptional activator
VSLKIFLLGVPRLEIDKKIVEIDTRKAVAILVYMALAEENRPSRDFLATFLWPDFDQSRARAALRRTLSAMRRDVGKQYFDITRDAVAFSPKAACWIDVVDFQEKAGSERVGDLETAVDLYRDDFMTGFTLRDSPPFDEWQFYQSEQLRRTFSRVLEQLIGQYRSQGQWAKAVGQARRWLALDPLREEAHRTLMSLLAWSGDRSQALRQYRECVRILDEELGVAPLPETTEPSSAARCPTRTASAACSTDPRRAALGPRRWCTTGARSGSRNSRAATTGRTTWSGWRRCAWHSPPKPASRCRPHGW